jgi:hypothetical protein
MRLEPIPRTLTDETAYAQFLAGLRQVRNRPDGTRRTAHAEFRDQLRLRRDLAEPGTYEELRRQLNLIGDRPDWNPYAFIRSVRATVAEGRRR